jgi:protein gp37
MRHKAKIVGAKLPDQYLKPFNKLQLFPSRLSDPDLYRKSPCKIFITPQTDVEYIPRDWLEHILGMCDGHPWNKKNTFMFLSKNAQSYKGTRWPSNTMQGLTITGNEKWENNVWNILEMIKWPRPFLSIEPLLGCLVGISIPQEIELIIVGAMSGPGAIPPKPEWIQSIKDNIPAEKIYWKKNIRKYL